MATGILIKMTRILSILLAIVVLLAGNAKAIALGSNATIYPAPAGELLSSDYSVDVDGQPTPVYKLKVAPLDASRRLAAMDYSVNSIGHIFDEAAFSYFDMQGEVEVSVAYKEPIVSVRLMPNVPGTKLKVSGNTVRFRLKEPGNLTLELNNQIVSTLHIFANPVQTYQPSPNDPNVIYFGPGVHVINHLLVGDGKTLYIAGGAIVKTALEPNEPFQINKMRNLPIYEPAIKIQGTGIKVCGRGIIDGSLVPVGQKLLRIKGQDITMDGIILRDPSNWTMPIEGSSNVAVSNLKILGYRLNSDGIDILSSHNVSVQNCFIRTFDDLIVVKSHEAEGHCAHIVASANTLWNEKGHAMTIGTDVQKDISDVKFIDNNVIRDLSHDWAMCIYLADTGNVSNVLFENIRVDQLCLPGLPEKDCPGLISLSIKKSGWGRGTGFGRIRNVTFKNIQASRESAKPPIILSGQDAVSDVEDVRFDNVIINGQPIVSKEIKKNAFVEAVSVRN